MGAKPNYQNIDGFTVAASYSVEAFRSALAYRPRDDDLFVVTFPKCGTTWTQNIVCLILNDGKPFKDTKEFILRTPFLEMLGAEAAESMPRPGTIKLHLPYHLTPYSPSAKYIYVSRNPKDACVSFYYHTLGFQNYEFDGTFDDYFEIFYNGENDFGEYFMHTLSWYKHRNDPNVLFLTYEEMKKDIRSCIIKIAEFLGDKYVRMLQEQPEVLENILKYSSKEEMKRYIKAEGFIPMDIPINSLPLGLRHLQQWMKDRNLDQNSNFQFVRKGVIGDWRNHLSEEQARRLDSKTLEKLKDTDLLRYWKELGILE